MDVISFARIRELCIISTSLLRAVSYKLPINLGTSYPNDQRYREYKGKDIAN